MPKIYPYFLKTVFSIFIGLIITVTPLESFSQPQVITTAVIQGLTQPLQLVNAGDGSNRIFIVEKGGTIRLYDQLYHSKGIFLTVPGLSTDGEHGLLSMVFHPDYLHNGFFYVYYTNQSGDLELTRYHVSSDPDLADETSGTILLTIPHPDHSNHNGGELHFGPDGYLYLSTGDGGGTGDADNNAQNISVLLGKILRIDVDHTSTLSAFYSIPSGNPYNNEIFCTGLRNPFRWSFDRLTGDIWIGDVGQDAWEEISYLPNPSGGENFGWRCYEGSADYNTSACNTNNGLDITPAFAYPTTDPAASVIGGLVYRGSNTGLQGYYLAADYFTGVLYTMKPAIAPANGWNVSQQSFLSGIADFGETENGEAYAVSLNAGTIYQLTAANTLPVTLVDFDAVPGNQAVDLYWSTSSEQNTERYEIEYSSDGNGYALAGTVKAGNLASGSKYHFAHTLLRDGRIFYRLKMLEYDGNFSYSRVVSVNFSSTSSSGNFVIPSVIRKGNALNMYTNEPFDIAEIVSLSGAVILKQNLNAATGHLTLNPVIQASGVYIVRMSNRDKTLVQKIIVTD